MQMLFATMADVGTTVTPAFVARANVADLVTGIYDTHQRELFSFAIRSSRDPEVAADLVQEAFTRLIVEIEAGRTPDNIRAWLYRVIANLAVSGARRASVAHRQIGALVDRDVDEGPEPAYLDRERQSDLETALAELDTDARTALVMAASGFKGMEIADAIGRSGNATRTMMCRSRVHLRERLASMASA